jgi:hypothetical protein
MEAHVDHDLEQYFLLDIRTHNDLNETRDYLYVMVGIGCKVECEWHNQPLPFSASTEAHIERMHAGLTWFVSHIVAHREEQAQQ